MAQKLLTLVCQRTLAAALLLLVTAAGVRAASAPGPGVPPYPQSSLIRGITLDWSSYRSLARGSDNWITTWAENDKLYTSWGDGGGFGVDAVNKGYVSIGFAELTGNSAATVQGHNLIGGLDPTFPCFPYFTGNILDLRHQGTTVYPCYRKESRAKSRSLLALDGYLYAHLTPGSAEGSYREARLYRSKLGTNDWDRAPWAFTPTGRYPIIAPAFLQAGKNQSAEPNWVYAYAIRFAPIGGATKQDIQLGPLGGEITLMRAARSAGVDLLNPASWKFYAGLSGDGQPIWTPQQDQAKGVFFDKNGVGWFMCAYRVEALGRYLITTAHTKKRAGYVGIFEGPTAWGPWSTVFYGVISNTAAGAPPVTTDLCFLANSFTAGGRFTGVLVGSGVLDGLNLVDGSFQLGTAGVAGAASPPLQR
jgi:hypothetical protein